MRMLVTGSRGFIGAAVVRCALSRGLEVVAVDIATGERELPPNAEAVLGDINAPERWARKLKGVNTLIHCAAVHRVDQVMADPVKAIAVNLHGTRAVLAAAASAGVGRFVYLSTGKVYGDPVRVPCAETDPLMPLEPYGLSKAVAEQYCREFQAGTGMTCVSIRPFSVYGPDQDLDTGYIGQMIHALRNHKPAVLSGAPHFARDFVYIGDVVELCMRVGTGEVNFDVINAGSGQLTKLKDLVTTFNTLAGRNVSVEYKEPRSGTIDRACAALERISIAMPMKPTNLVDGLTRTLSSFL